MKGAIIGALVALAICVVLTAVSVALVALIEFGGPLAFLGVMLLGFMALGAVVGGMTAPQ